MLLHSCPDTVHGVLLRKTQTSTSLIEGSFAMKEPSDWHHPRCSGLRVQGTAISPAAPHFGMVPQTLPLQLTQPRHPYGTQELLLSAATFLS